MYWTLELASHLQDAPWPATRDELIDFAIRSGAPLEVIENLHFNIRVRDKLIQEHIDTIKSLNARIKAMTSPKELGYVDNEV